MYVQPHASQTLEAIIATINAFPCAYVGIHAHMQPKPARVKFHMSCQGTYDWSAGSESPRLQTSRGAASSHNVDFGLTTCVQLTAGARMFFV